MVTENVIYSLAGNFFSKAYKLVTWEYDGKKIIAPTPSLALFRYLKEYKKQDVKLKILIPLSIFDVDDIIAEKNSNNGNFELLIERFKRDFENFYTKKLTYLLEKFEKASISVKESQQTYNEIKAFVSFFKKEDLDWKDSDETFNKLIAEKEDLKEFYEELKQFLEKSKIFQILEEENLKWKKLLQGNIDYEIIPSIGSYKKEGKILKFNGKFQDRTLYFYTLFTSDFIKKLEQINTKNLNFRFYLDVSVGLNAFVVELLESFYNSAVFWNFYFLGKEENKGKFYLISAEPVTGIPQKEDIKHFSIEEVKRIAFFSKPLTKEKIEIQDFKRFSGILNFKGLSGLDFEEVINQSILLFNILEKGIILGLTLQRKLLKPIEILQGLNRFFKIKRRIFSKNFIDINNTIIEVNINPQRLNALYFRNLTYLIMLGINLTQNIWDLFKDYYKDSVKYLEFKDEALPIEKVKENFKQLFRKYGLDLNEVFINREWNKNRIKDLKKIASQKPQELATEREAKSQTVIANCHIKNIKEYLENKKRNFLAHMGTEDCITKFYLKNGTLYLKYDDKFKEKIKEFILNDFNFEN